MKDKRELVFLKRNRSIMCLSILFSVYLGNRPLNLNTDSVNYIREYLGGDGGYFKEYFFKQIGYILYTLKMNVHIYLIILSLLNTFFYYSGFKLILKKDKQFYIFWWLFIFSATYLYGSVNILRQSLAQGIFLISLYYLKKNRTFVFLFFIMLGIQFHMSIIFFVGLAFFKKIYKYIRKYNFSILIGIFLLNEILVKYLLIFPKFYRYFYYLKVNNSTYIKVILFLLVFLILVKIGKIEKMEEMIIFYGLILLIFFIKFPLLSGRLIYYINLIYMIVFYKIGKKYKYINVLIIFIYHLFVLGYPSTREMLTLI